MSDLVLSGLMDRLSKLYGLDISFHDCSGVSLAVPSLSLRAEQFTHDRPYCLLAKRLHLTACKGCKDRSYAHLLEVGNYSGTCPFGIWDVIHQVKFDGFALGAFYVGGLHGDRPLTHVSLLPKHELPQKRTTSLIKQCKDAAKLLEEALLIDYRLWLSAGNQLGKRISNAEYMERCQQFIKSHYHQDMGLQDLAEQLQLHPNYLGNLIQKEFGKNFRSLLNDYRVEQAQLILRFEGIPITEVAFRVGFKDSNYFSTVFKRIVGIPPKKYKQKIC